MARSSRRLLALPAVALPAGLVYALSAALAADEAVSAAPPDSTLQPFVQFFERSRSTGASSATRCASGPGSPWSASSSAIRPLSPWREPSTVLQIVMLVSIILPLVDRCGGEGLRLADRPAPRRRRHASSSMGLGIWDEPQRLLFTETGLVLGAANIFLPFMILPIYSVVKLIDPAAERRPARPWAPRPIYRFTHVTSCRSPCPGVVSGIAFVFSHQRSRCSSSPSLLIGDRFQTLSTLDRPLLPADAQRGSSARPRPSSCWCWPLPIVVGSTWLAPPAWGHAHDGASSGRHAILHLVQSRLFTVVFLMTPLVVTVAVSFGSSAVFTLPPPGWSMRWYNQLPATRGLWPSLATSVQIAALSTLVSLMLGTLCAIALVRGKLRRARRHRRPSSSRR